MTEEQFCKSQRTIFVVPKSTQRVFYQSFYEDMQKYKDWWFEEELTLEELEMRIVEE